MVTITSVFKTLRPCLSCGVEFLPPKRPDRLVLDYCSAACERRAGLRPMRRTYADPAPSTRAARGRTVGKPVRLTRRVVPIVRSAFADRLIEHRMRLELTQPAVARRIGVSAHAVARWECDEVSPGVRALAALADLFGVSMDALWTGRQDR